MSWLDDAKSHAQAEYPKESCGLVLDNLTYFPCVNRAQSGKHFIMAPQSRLEASRIGEATEVVHSHPDASANPSQADLVGCEASKLPWTILGVPSGAVVRFKPSGYCAPLIGREYAFGILDCWTIVRDWFKEARGIALHDFESGEEEWWLKGGDLYRDNFAKAGFHEIAEKELQHGDCILFAFRSPVPNHAAVYLGNQQMLHHLTNRLSCREVYGGFYRKIATHFLRYRA
jgi:cell wall-associated NlpC family hydrolase